MSFAAALRAHMLRKPRSWPKVCREQSTMASHVSPLKRKGSQSVLSMRDAPAASTGGQKKKLMVAKRVASSRSPKTPKKNRCQLKTPTMETPPVGRMATVGSSMCCAACNRSSKDILATHVSVKQSNLKTRALSCITVCLLGAAAFPLSLSTACIRAKETPWAATRQEHHGAKIEYVAVGHARDRCYHIATDVLGMGSFDDYVTAMSSGELEADKIKGINDSLDRQGPQPDFMPKQVCTVIGSTIEVEREFRGKPFASLKAVVKQSRIAQKVLDFAPKVSMPCEHDLTRREDYWLFEEDGDKWEVGERKIKIKKHTWGCPHLQRTSL